MEFFKNLKVVPRWFIILIDGLIIFHATFFAFFIRFNFNLELVDRYQILPGVVLFSVLSVFSMLLTRSYVGIVRHTNISDLVTMMKMLALTQVLLFGIKQANLSYNWFESNLFLPFSVALIASLLAFPLLLGYRLLVREIYQYAKYTGHKDTTKKIAIYGAGEAGLLTYNALNGNSDDRRLPVAFIDDDFKKAGKLLQGKIIYQGLEGLKKAVEKHGIQEVVIAINMIESSRKRAIVDACLDLGIPAKIIPPVKDWFNIGLKTTDIKEIKIEDLLSREEIVLDRQLIDQSFSGKVILVTGAAGSIGSELCRQILHCKPALLLMLDQAESPLFEIEQELNAVNQKVSRKAVLADIRNKQKMLEVFSTYYPQLVFHAAAYKHVPLMEEFPEEAIRTNLFGTKVLADLSSQFNVEKFVMVSTDKAVNPTNVMGATKRAAEIYVQALDKQLGLRNADHTRFITTRFGNVLGSNGSVIPLFKKQIQQGGPVKVTHPEVTRYFMTIPEACQLVLEAGAMGLGGEIFVFDMGQPVKIVELAKKMIQLSGKKVGKDIEIEFSGLRPGEKLFEELLNHFELVKETHHPKIKIAQVNPSDYLLVNSEVKMFKKLLEAGSEMEVVKHLKNMVPEFISNYSRFEELDSQGKLLN